MSMYMYLTLKYMGICTSHGNFQYIHFSYIAYKSYISQRYCQCAHFMVMHTYRIVIRHRAHNVKKRDNEAALGQ